MVLIYLFIFYLEISALYLSSETKDFFPPLFPDKPKLHISPDPPPGWSHQNIAGQPSGAGPRGELCPFSQVSRLAAAVFFS